MLVPATVADWTLALASRHTYTLDAALPLLCVLPSSAVPTVRTVVLQRIVSPTALVATGAPLAMLKLACTRRIFFGAATSELAIDLGTAAISAPPSVLNDTAVTTVLEWAASVEPRILSPIIPSGGFSATAPVQLLVQSVVRHDRLAVLDWLAKATSAAADSPIFISQPVLNRVVDLAIIFCRPHILEWLAKYAATATQLTFMVPEHESLRFNGAELAAKDVVRTLEWVAAYLSAHPRPPPPPHPIGRPIQYKLYTFPPLGGTGSDADIAALEWLWEHYFERSRNDLCNRGGRVQWMPCITATMYACADPVQIAWIHAKSMATTNEKLDRNEDPDSGFLNLDLMCMCGTPALLDWWWKTRTDTAKLTWRPSHAFSKVEIADWWYAKHQEGIVDEVFFTDCIQGSFPIRGSSTLRTSRPAFELAKLHTFNPTPIAMLEWYRDHRHALGLVDGAFEYTAEMANEYSNRGLLSHMQWWWSMHVQSPGSVFPITLAVVCNAVKLGHVHLLAWLWSLHVDHGVTFPSLFARLILERYKMTPLMLDLLWDILEAAGVSLYKDGEAVVAHVLDLWTRGDQYNQVDWWFAMHCVHGTAFPTREQLDAGIADGSEECARNWCKRHGMT